MNSIEGTNYLALNSINQESTDYNYLVVPSITYTDLDSTAGNITYSCMYAEIPIPKKVRFYPPRTVVYWEDGTKTVVKCSENDTFDKLTGYLLAFYEKVNGLSKKQTSKLLKEALGE